MSSSFDLPASTDCLHPDGNVKWTPNFKRNSPTILLTCTVCNRYWGRQGFGDQTETRFIGRYGPGEIEEELDDPFSNIKPETWRTRKPLL